ncbi:MAG TPA: hypothetical protein VHV08_15680, partial [Pirellulales bacterium]|nr:hypothetical protein [Pirellulales bacterium]
MFARTPPTSLPVKCHENARRVGRMRMLWLGTAWAVSCTAITIAAPRSLPPMADSRNSHRRISAVPPTPLAALTLGDDASLAGNAQPTNVVLVAPREYRGDLEY